MQRVLRGHDGDKLEHTQWRDLEPMAWELVSKFKYLFIKEVALGPYCHLPLLTSCHLEEEESLFCLSPGSRNYTDFF